MGNENSGRKSDADIIRKYVDQELANKIANRELKRIDEKEGAELEELKVIVMPIVTKGMVTKSENTLIIPEPILKNVLSNNGNPQGNGDEKKDTSDTGRNERQQDSIDNLVSDSFGAI
jgi:hypothetical protein